MVKLLLMEVFDLSRKQRSGQRRSTELLVLSYLNHHKDNLKLLCEFRAVRDYKQFCVGLCFFCFFYLY